MYRKSIRTKRLEAKRKRCAAMRTGGGASLVVDATNIKAYLREEWDCAAFDDANAHPHGRAPARTVRMGVGNSGGDK